MLLSQMDINAHTVKALAKRKIITDEDLLRIVPTKYRDYSTVYVAQTAPLDEYAAIRGTLLRVGERMGARAYLSARIESGGTPVNIVIFSRLFWLKRLTELVNQEVVVLGKVTLDPTYGFSVMEPDDIVPAVSFSPRIATVYPKYSGLSESAFRSAMDYALDAVHEPFEWELFTKMQGYDDYKTALMCVHRPQALADIPRGKRRLLLNDLLYFAIKMQEEKAKTRIDSDILFPSTELTGALLERLPYRLTHDQASAVFEISERVRSGKRLNMLLEGDVGSGKTIVAIAFLLMAVDNGYQGVFMAPREVLAMQHFESVNELLGPMGIKVAFLRSGMKVSERKKMLSEIEKGEISIIVGTHTCIGESVCYHSLGAVVIDEEHLFGVRHKAEILAKAQSGVHTLALSATPIPRTLASALYTEDKIVMPLLSMPEGRKKTVTQIADRASAFDLMRSELAAGHQTYVVCPAIEEDAEENGLVSVEQVMAAYKDMFEPCGYSVACVHGKMKKGEVDGVISDFSSGKLNVLVSTTVIEVGVNVPNATVIVVEQAERFGLASLHQLRGRVGRSHLQAYCVLRSEDTDNPRLQTVVSTTDGFKIAEADWEQRGSGNLIGAEQSGWSKYTVLMMENKGLYDKLTRAAQYCVENRFGKGLVQAVEEGHREA